MKIICKHLGNGASEALFTYIEEGLKVTKKIALNELVDLDDEICYAMIAEYRGVFEVWKYLRPHQREKLEAE